MSEVDPVVIAEYALQWPIMFEAEARELRAAFRPDAIEVEHIGSTAVPGLGAKPIVDILLGAAALAQIERHIATLEAHGYRYVPEFETQLPQRRYFEKPKQGPEQFHLHAVEWHGAFWRDQLRFRDALRNDPTLCEQYLCLKRRLAVEYYRDRAAYTDAKAPFIERTLSELSRPA